MSAPSGFERTSFMAGMVSITSFPKVSLGSDLERRRLEQRARHLRLVIALLHERASTSARAGATPPGLQHAIADFSAELSQVRHGLHGDRADSR
jgi:hypothetical protein